MKKQISIAFMVCGIVFTSCLLISNIIAQKIISIGPFESTAGVLVFPVSYILNDIIAEVWGYRKARFIIWFGFLMNFFAVVIFKLSILIPGSVFFTSQSAFETTLNSTFQITLASFMAFLCGSFTNAFVMSRMKIRQKGKNFSLRAIVSTVFGESIDSLIFYSIAFFGLPVKIIVTMIFTQILMKTTYEIIVLPLTNYIVRWVKKQEETDVFDTGISYNPLKIKDI